MLLTTTFAELDRIKDKARQEERERYRPLVEAVEAYEAEWQRVIDSVQNGTLTLGPDGHNERIRLRVALFDALQEAKHKA